MYVKFSSGLLHLKLRHQREVMINERLSLSIGRGLRSVPTGVGNFRMTFTAGSSTPQVLQNDDHYSFGNTFNSSVSSGGKNNFLFNGMELNENTLNTYDFYISMYDQQSGRSFQRTRWKCN